LGSDVRGLERIVTDQTTDGIDSRFHDDVNMEIYSKQGADDVINQGY
jgi:hypothetical protein